MTITYPGGAPTVNGTRLTVDNVLKRPDFLQKRIVPDNRVFLSDLLFRKASTTSGAVVYNVATQDPAYPTRGDAEVVEPGAEFPMIDWSDGQDMVATATKLGAGYIVTDEARDRNNMDVIAKGNAKVRNAVIRQDAYRSLAAFRAAVPVVSSTATWDTAKAMRTDVVKAISQIRRTQLGYSANTVLINPDTQSNLLLLDELQNLAPREDPNRNPLYSAQLADYLGVNWVVNDFVPAGEAIVLQAGMTGAVVEEKPFAIEVVREGTRQRTVVIGSRRSVPVVDEPQSAVIIKGV